MFLGIFLMALFFPLSGDDWNRMAQLDRSLSWFLYAIDDQWHHLNGRIVGNLISYLFIKPAPVRAFFKALAWVGLVKFVMAMTDREQPIWIWFTGALLTLIPIEVFRQVWVWSAGFFNYVPPMLCFFIFLWKGINLIQEGDRPPGPALIGWLVFAIQAGLYVENLTVLFVLFTGFLLVYYRLVRGSTSLTSLILFTGALIGFALMFASPVYRRVLTGEDDYRSVATGFEAVFELVKGNWPQFSRYMLRRNPLQVVLISAFLGMLLLERGLFDSLVTKLSYLGVILLSLGFVVTPGLESEMMTNLNFFLDLFVHLAYYLLVLFLGLEVLSEVKHKRIWAASIISLPLGMGSLLFVTPVVARNFILPAFLQVFWIVILATELGERVHSFSDVLVAKRAVYTLAVGVYAFYMVVYIANGLSFFERNRIMQEAVDLSLDYTTIKHYPFEWAVATDDPGKIGKYYFKEKAYDIDVSYEEDWEEDH